MEFINNTSFTREEDLKRLKFIQEAILNLNNPNTKVLDVGCGNGYTLSKLVIKGH